MRGIAGVSQARLSSTPRADQQAVVLAVVLLVVRLDLLQLLEISRKGVLRHRLPLLLPLLLIEKQEREKTERRGKKMKEVALGGVPPSSCCIVG